MNSLQAPIAAHAVVAHRWGSLHLRSFQLTEEAAIQVMHHSIDIHPLQVLPCKVSLAANGNVQLWTVTPPISQAVNNQGNLK